LPLLKESITNDLKNHRGVSITPILNVTWAEHYDPLALAHGVDDGDDRGKILSQLPFIKESNWYYDKIIESKEEQW